MKFFRYTGSVENLKSLGYKFQKLYAHNYITYSKDNIIMYKLGGFVVEVDNLPAEQQQMVIQFILDNQHQPSEFWRYKSRAFKDYYPPEWSLIDGIIYNRQMKIEAYRAGNEEIAHTTGFLLTKEFIDNILNLQNHLELKEIV